MSLDREDVDEGGLTEEEREMLLDRLDSIDDEESHLSTADVFEELGFEEHLSLSRF